MLTPFLFCDRSQYNMGGGDIMYRRESTIRKAERRFLEAKGAQFMNDGKTVRCQTVSRRFLRQRREETGNPHLSVDDIWPEGQCTKPALPGYFLCRYHARRLLRPVYRDITDYMPINLRHILQVLSNTPNLADRRQAILQLQARNAQLFEQLKEGAVGGNLTLRELEQGLREIEQGELLKGTERIRAVIEGKRREMEIWEEIRANQELERKQVVTQAELYKTMRTMATPEQVSALVKGLYQTFVAAVDSQITDEVIRDRILRAVAADLLRKANLAGDGITMLLHEGSENGDRAERD